MSANPKENKPGWEQGLDRVTSWVVGCYCAPDGSDCEFHEALDDLRAEILAMQDYIKDLEARDDRLIDIIENFRAATWHDWAGSNSPLARAIEKVKQEGLA